tara:strand:- start:95 stop:730 length:636 start_codon:yes stop_codon:yes gene_type:complete
LSKKVFQNKFLKKFFLSKYNFFLLKKYSPNYNYSVLRKKLNNKKIALVGNSKKILKHKDNKSNKKFDFVIRINVYPKIKSTKSFIDRCDILMFSNNPENYLKKNCLKVWLGERRYEYWSNITKEITYNSNPDWYRQLELKLKAPPSTGAMAFNFLTKILKNPKITLIGFEHKQGNAWYKKLNQPKDSHNYKNEKKFFEEILKKNTNIKRLS